jgi:hypothetical protein
MVEGGYASKQLDFLNYLDFFGQGRGQRINAKKVQICPSYRQSWCFPRQVTREEKGTLRSTRAGMSKMANSYIEISLKKSNPGATLLHHPLPHKGTGFVDPELNESLMGG